MLKSAIIICLIQLMVCVSALAGDMREDHLEIEAQKRAFLEQAALEKKQAAQAAENRRKEIASGRESLTRAVQAMVAQNKVLQEEAEQLDKAIADLKTEEKSLRASLAETEAVNRELAGFVRGTARDLDGLLSQSLQTALNPDRGDFLRPMIDTAQFPSMDDIKMMGDVLFDEIRKSGEVRLVENTIVDRKGRETPAEILIIGNFTAAYQLEDETGFLLFSDQSKRLFALSKLPTRRILKTNQAYIQGHAQGVYLDISKGGALRQLTHQLSLIDQVPKGGPIVWPILAILGIAMVIVIERLVFLFRKNMDADGFMAEVCRHAAMGTWDQCRSLCRDHSKKSIPRIMMSGLDCVAMERVDMENALQESILREIPTLERFMSTLGMLAAIAPLLGLLGTVTGMINTFHVITYYGTGDPRMMSGGISEALVTTMLGLSVAIPIMLVHTLLNRKIETEIGLMEEKAVAFVNTVFKVRA